MWFNLFKLGRYRIKGLIHLYCFKKYKLHVSLLHYCQCCNSKRIITSLFYQLWVSVSQEKLPERVIFWSFLANVL